MTSCVIFWFRRDLRLEDHPGLCAAAAAGVVLPVFILDPETEALGAAPKWRLGEGLAAFDAALRARGSRLILRRGDALQVLTALAQETGAGSVHWQRLYDPAAIARDTRVKSGLREAGIGAESHPGHVLFEPWDVATGTGGFYKVYTPFWRAVRGREPGPALPAPDLGRPNAWPQGAALDGWRLGAAMDRGAAVVARHANVGAEAAQGRLGAFTAGRIGDYKEARDRLDLSGTSNLSENLSLGEIGPRTCWHAGRRAMEAGKAGAETFLQELVWRDFAYHLLYHTPHIVERSWREEWQDFPWAGDNDAAERWRRGMTGEPVVDAAMREMQVTGRMHNRGRMLVASYLTKHLMTHWSVGMKWFDEHLIDWDPASNAMGWQWAAGSGPDATPFFRIFNPRTQGERFDPQGAYRRRFVAELSDNPGPDARAFFEAVPRSWGLSPDQPYPDPMVDLKAGRERALRAYHEHRAQAA